MRKKSEVIAEFNTAKNVFVDQMMDTLECWARKFQLYSIYSEELFKGFMAGPKMYTDPQVLWIQTW